MTRRVAGLELGGTKCIAVLAEDERIIARDRVPTTDPASTLAALRAIVARWHGEEALAGIGIAAFGPVTLDRENPRYGRIGRSPKLAWRDADVVAPLADLGAPVLLDTDVGGAALAEGRWGASQGCAVHIYMTVGTGVGGGLVIDGKPVHGFLHPEMGHVSVRRAPGDGFAGVCPFHGDCLEGLVSGTAIAARAGQKAENLADDDPVWALVAGELGDFVASMLLTVSAERIVFGGGLGFGQPHLLPLVRTAATRTLNGYLDGDAPLDMDAIVVLAELGADAGPMGAVALGLQAASA